MLERTSSSFKDITLRSDLKGFDAAKHTVKAEALCLPVAGMLNTPLASKIVAAISGINVVNMAAGRLDPVNPKETFSEERLRKYISIIKKPIRPFVILKFLLKKRRLPAKGFLRTISKTENLSPRGQRSA